jgi:hypothetical protein
MEIKDKNLFVSEYAQLLKDKWYIELLEKYNKDIDNRRKQVFAMYTSIEWGHLTENQIYNEKNAAVEILSILLDAKEDFEKIQLTWTKYILEELEELIKWHAKMIQENIGWLSSWLTMSVYTETDIILKWVSALESVVTCYEKELENCKKVEQDDSTTTEVEEDNS